MAGSNVCRGVAILFFAALLSAGCGSNSGIGSVTPSPQLSPSTPFQLPSPTPNASPPPSPSSNPSTTTRLLDIAIDLQDHPLSCEAAALKMALSYEGIKTDENALLAFIGSDTRPAVVDAGGRLIRWGNPNVSFVGNPDGKLTNYTGYGVYAGPIAKAAAAAGGNVLAWGTNLPPDRGKGISPDAVYQALLDGHPVIAWISNTYHDLSLGTYTAFDGTTVYYTLTEHAVTLVGVRPDAVLINDPWFGQSWHSKAQFESAFHTFEEMAVVLN
jgi:uncharacterized protein YvpB